MLGKPECSRCQVCAHVVEAELGVIKNIEELSAELQASAFGGGPGPALLFLYCFASTSTTDELGFSRMSGGFCGLLLGIASISSVGK